MYTEIYNILARSRMSGDKEEIKRALIVSIEEIRQSLRGKLSYQTFSNFIHDPHLLLGGELEISYEKVVDSSIKTSGMIAQLLEILGVSSYTSLSNKLKESIFNLHAVLSRGLDSIQKEKKDLEDILDQISSSIN